jgi:hypothetical protein
LSDLWESIFTRQNSSSALDVPFERAKHCLRGKFSTFYIKSYNNVYSSQGLRIQDRQQTKNDATHEITHRRTELRMSNLREKVPVLLQCYRARKTCSLP